MWLLNHTSARRFDVEMLKRIGFSEIFLPKSFPQDIGFRSASIDFSEDDSLSIPASDLAVLNQTDWYSEQSRDVWDLANRYFDLLFCMMRPSVMRGISMRFRGAAILRAYGLSKDTSYSVSIAEGAGGLSTVQNMGRRFWLGTAYEWLADAESPWLKNREIYLPLGLSDCLLNDHWIGGDPKIFFVCPDIEGISYYSSIYQEFKKQFTGFPYAVGGAQALATNDSNVLGFVPDAEHQRNMREFRVMFYHSTAPNHVHYHPLEAVRAGMPLVFMAGGMLDRLGGTDLPGRCRSYDEARNKIRRILGGDVKLVESIRSTQPVLLTGLSPQKLEQAWRTGLTKVLKELETSPPHQNKRRSRIAVVLPVPYRGGTLRSAKLLAETIGHGSRLSGEDAEVVLAYPTSRTELEPWDAGLSPTIGRRTIRWETVTADSARRAMRFAGHADWSPVFPEYMVPDDRTQNLLDCDLWIVVSDRLEAPLLPIRPHVLIIYDYVQRYERQFTIGFDTTFIDAAQNANRVLVTTRFTEHDALSYAGVARDKVVRVPMLAPYCDSFKKVWFAPDHSYFLWTTNPGSHKNHQRALCALHEYYQALSGQLDCVVTGPESVFLANGGLPHLESARNYLASNPSLRRRLRIMGELPEAEYRSKLAGASFVWHPARIDNGTLTVIEAAALGVPALSSKYPAMAELDEEFNLHLVWMDSSRPGDMALRLKWMEQHNREAKADLPSFEELHNRGDRNAAAYWSVIRECL